MKLKIKYLLFTGVCHVVCLVLSYLILAEHPLIFMIAEVLIILSFFLAWKLYKDLILPLEYLREGIRAIKEKDFTVKFLQTGKKDVDELVMVYNHMIDELRIERTKQEEQHFFLDKLIETSPTGIIILDYNGELKQINSTASELLRLLPDLLDNQLKNMKLGESELIRSGSLRTFKVQKSHFLDHGFPRVFMMIEEVTAEIFEAEKQVYSKVIRMMAHEVNNTVGPVNSIMDMTLQHPVLWADQKNTALQKALGVAMQRNHNLNLFMRNFADLVKLSPVNKVSVDVSKLVNTVADLMHFTVGDKIIHLVVNGSEYPFHIQADALQLEQALLNILKNSIEAISGMGEISLDLYPEQGKLVITDNGSGLSGGPDEILFSPFYTTKKDGQGIGLTLVREILINHGFEFNLQTTANGRTAFSIFFR